MLWFRALLCCLFFVLKGCAPLLTSFPGGGQDKLRKTYVRGIDDRRGQYMRLRLMQKIDAEDTDCYQYFLQINLGSDEQGLALSEKGLAVRNRLTTTASYTLFDQNGNPLTSGKLKAHGSYNLVENEIFAVTSARKMTEEANIDRLTDNLILSLALYFERSGP